MNKRELKPTIFLPKNRRGQFYLIMALVAVGIMAGISVTANSAQKKPYDKIYDLAEEIKIESSKVIEYGILKGLDMNTLLTDFATNYGNYKNEQNMYFIFGTTSSIKIIGYQTAYTEDVKVNGLPIGFSGDPPYATITPANPLPIQIGENSYSLDLKQGQNFYFILTKNFNGERYVISG